MKILIVEDDPAVRKLLNYALEKARYEVVLAEDGVQGVSAAEREQPGVILMDLSLPGIDGIQAIRRIRRDPGLRTVPILVLTGHSTLENVKEAIQAGADDFLVKSDMRVGSLLDRLDRTVRP